MCVNGVQIPLEKPQTLLGFLKEQVTTSTASQWNAMRKLRQKKAMLTFSWTTAM